MIRTLPTRPGLARGRGASEAARVLILAYHRVFDPPSDPQLMSVAPANFEAHLRYLKRAHRVMSLEGALATLRKGELRGPAVVITFDDGYADNLFEAAPLLYKYEIPATFFVATGNVGTYREFWWDELERLVLLSSPIVEHLVVRVNGALYQWSLNPDGVGRIPGRARFRRWNVLAKFDPTPRHRAYRQLCMLLRGVSGDERDRVMAQLRVQMADQGNARADYRAITPEELQTLVRFASADVGAHTVNHVKMSALGSDARRRELQDSRNALEGWLRVPVRGLAFPYGGRSDARKRVARLAAEAGYGLGCLTVAGAATSRSRDLALPRMLVRNWETPELAANIQPLLDG